MKARHVAIAVDFEEGAARNQGLGLQSAGGNLAPM
jgi:hypothetical protein